MLTLKRFKALLESYGAELQRWPAETRAPAQALLAQAREANDLLAEARLLDAAIAGASRLEASAASPAQAQAALASLRSVVAARIAATGPNPRAGRGWRGLALGGGLGGAVRLQAGWLGMAIGSAGVVAIGLSIGSLSVSVPPPPDQVMAMLQPAPIHLLGG